jgi:starch-binding outer membrane protein, SusD/RagB family
MKNIIMKKFSYLFLALLVLISSASCDKEYLNPSAASEPQVVSDVNGLISLANGLQRTYSAGGASPEYAVSTANGLLSKELTVLNVGNTNEEYLRQGASAVTGSNTVLSNLWNQNNLVKANANIILNNLGIVSDQGTKGGLQVHASIFKALALGNLAMFWEKAPLKVEKNAEFVERVQILNEAITTLESAAAELQKAAISTYFTSKIVSGIDYANTINALIARYSLMVGNYDKALTAANAVTISLTTKSIMLHDDISPNALYFSSFATVNNTEPVNTTFSLPASMLPLDANDKRITFFFNATPGLNKGRASFFSSNTVAVPVYRPGEITLIKAEANVRKSSQDLTAAVTELNKILTKAPASDALGIGTGLATTYGGANTDVAILDEIYKQRCMELYLSGMRLEDSRRFGRPLAERGRNFLPYPFTERDNNTNTPADPAL